MQVVYHLVVNYLIKYQSKSPHFFIFEFFPFIHQVRHGENKLVFVDVASIGRVDRVHKRFSHIRINGQDRFVIHMRVFL